MRTRWALAWMAVMLLGFTGFSAIDPGGRLARLRGQWQLVSTENQKHRDNGSAEIRMGIGGDGRAVFTFCGLPTNEGAICLGRVGRLDTLDLRLPTGDVVRGIYRLKGEELSICFDGPGKPRPVRWTPTGTQWVERWQRAVGVPTQRSHR